MTNTRQRAGLRLLAAAALFAFSLQAGPAAAVAIARYSGGEITLAEFKAYFAGMMGEEELKVLLADSARVREGVRRLVFLKAVSAMAVREGMDKEADFVDTVEDFRIGTLSEQMREAIRSKVKVTDADVLAAMEPVPPRTRISWAAFSSREEAEALRAAASAGGDFETLAVKMTNQAVGMTGENLFNRGDPSLLRFSEASKGIVGGLKDGDLSPVLEEPIGFMVVHATYVDSGELEKLERDKLRQTILKEKQAAAVSARVRELRSKAVIAVDDKALGDVSPGAENETVAVVNRRAITLRGLAHGTPLHKDMARVRRNALEELIGKILLYEEAVRLGLDKESAFHSQQRFFALETLQRRYLDRRITGPVRVSDADVEEYYRSSPERFTYDEGVRLGKIVFANRVVADKFYGDLTAGRISFEELARTQSIDSNSAAKGGDAGWVKLRDLKSPFKEVVAGLKTGEFSSPFKSVQWYIVKVQERFGGHVAEFDAVKDTARGRALIDKKAHAITEFSDRVMKEAGVTFDDKALEAAGK